jgi:hypothetical protein
MASRVMTMRPQSLTSSSVEVAVGSLASIMAAQVICWSAGLPIALAVKLNIEIYAASFAIRLLVRRRFESRKDR